MQFSALVAAPTLAAAIYFGLIAAPQYVSHTEYIVRGVDAQRASGLAALLNTFGVSRAADETSAIESFLQVARGAGEAQRAHRFARGLRRARRRQAVALSPLLGARDVRESLRLHALISLMSARTPQTGVTKLEVAAFDARAAEAIAAAMLDLGGRHGQQPQRESAG